ncbi:MAG: YetF domain-containing protein [Gemmatimonadota bacterium]
MNHSLWFSNWTVIWRTLAVGAAAYAALVLLLRITGQRTLSKMNAFDFLVTVALGSTLASVLLSKDVVFAQGVTALVVLIGLQYIMTWLAVRSRGVQRLLTGEPVLLAHRGVALADAMRRSRITPAELGATVRSAGIDRLADVEAVVLETDGSFSVIRKHADSSVEGSSLVPPRR